MLSSAGSLCGGISVKGEALEEGITGSAAERCRGRLALLSLGWHFQAQGGFGWVAFPYTLAGGSQILFSVLLSAQQTRSCQAVF